MFEFSWWAIGGITVGVVLVIWLLIRIGAFQVFGEILECIADILS